MFGTLGAGMDPHTYASTEYEAVRIRRLNSRLQKMTAQLHATGIGLCGSTEAERTPMGKTGGYKYPWQMCLPDN